MSTLNWALNRFAAKVNHLTVLLRGTRVVHTFGHGDFRVKVFRGRSRFRAKPDTVIVEAPHGFGRWTPIGVFDPDDLQQVATLLQAAADWYHGTNE